MPQRVTEQHSLRTHSRYFQLCSGRQISSTGSPKCRSFSAEFKDGPEQTFVKRSQKAGLSVPKAYHEQSRDVLRNDVWQMKCQLNLCDKICKTVRFVKAMNDSKVRKWVLKMGEQKRSVPQYSG
ncbi:hypothetical protein TNCV_2102641 [Trichonephila clavipes]|nr:hypothetical protein TNCV_2102641 [Trichonephila clavipes]